MVQRNIGRKKVQVCEPALSRGHVDAVGEVSLVSFPTGLLARLMPVSPKAHCQLKLWWTGAWEGGGSTEAQLGYMMQPLYPPPPPTPSSPCITPSLHLSPIGLRVLRARKGRKGLIGRSECPGYTDSMDFGPP